MRASSRCIELIKRFEGFSAVPYKCPADIPTIGYGSTRYANGEKVKLTDPPINQAIAESLLQSTLVTYQEDVNAYVKVPITQNQYDALVDFAYNLGSQALRVSTLLKKVNAGKHYEASKEFSRWVYANGKILMGLVKRREAERSLFMEGLK